MDEEVVPVLRVEDAGRAVAWYGRLGFVKEWEHRFEPGFPWFVSVARGDVRLYLSEHTGDARPDTLIHLYVRDIDAVSEEFGTAVDEDGLAGRRVPPHGPRRQPAARRHAASLMACPARAPRPSARHCGRCQGRADARTRTGDPFITSWGRHGSPSFGLVRLGGGTRATRRQVVRRVSYGFGPGVDLGVDPNQSQRTLKMVD